MAGSPLHGPAETPALPVSPADANGGWPAEAAAGWPGSRQTATSDVSDLPLGGRVNRFVSSDPVASPRMAASDESLTAAAAGGGASLEYRGRPLRLATSRRFSWDYDIHSHDPNGRPLRVELWSTRDGGVTWQRAGIDTDGVSPIDVSLPAAGLYGFRLEIAADASGFDLAPATGTPPEVWVAVDDVPPQIDLEAVPLTDSDGRTRIDIRYVSRDEMLAPASVKISFSPQAEGPWSMIASGLDATGSYRWEPERTVPPRVFLRVETRDVAGNTGHAVTAEPVMVSTPRVIGHLRGLRELPAPPTGSGP